MFLVSTCDSVLDTQLASSSASPSPSLSAAEITSCDSTDYKRLTFRYLYLLHYSSAWRKKEKRIKIAAGLMRGLKRAVLKNIKLIVISVCVQERERPASCLHSDLLLPS